MEVLCFALGLICGMLAVFILKDGKVEMSTTPSGEKMPKELRAQYESLFGYDGKGREE